MENSTLSTAGLLMDAGGVVLLYFYGIPHRSVLQGQLRWGSPSESEEKRVRFLSGSGLVLLLVGFLLQALANHL